ncbi:MAG: ribonuclease HI [Chloroflexota bacterium]|nr:ribonuclease HI [Chloroflexota bacterium]
MATGSGAGQRSAPRKELTIHTDGACLGNPGPGGYGVILDYGGHRRELSGGYRLTTNNRMELTAAVEGLAALKEPCTVTLYSDSAYVVRGMSEGWARRWRANGWRREGRKLASNRDLWARLLDLCQVHDVTFRWVRGHAGNPDNERCDQLAVAAAHQAGLPADPGYEASVAGPGARADRGL